MSVSANDNNHDDPMHAMVDFACLDNDCGTAVCFNVMDLEQSKGRVSCPECHREYHFDQTFLDKLKRFRKLILALQQAEDILGEANVAVTTSTGEVKIPYRLLLTRLNTLISLNVGDSKIDFNFRVEPLGDATFR